MYPVLSIHVYIYTYNIILCHIVLHYDTYGHSLGTLEVQVDSQWEASQHAHSLEEAQYAEEWPAAQRPKSSETSLSNIECILYAYMYIYRDRI